jgi:osmotically-inducible protein OsmY
MRSRALRVLPVAFALAIGAALAFFLDPRAGRRRRHVARDRAVASARRALRQVRRTARHARADGLGLERRLVHRLRRDERELDDVTLAHKVESVLFRDPAVPKGRLSINAERGVVFLRGEVEQPDLIETLGERVRRVSGVKGVENRLHLPGSPPPA